MEEDSSLVPYLLNKKHQNANLHVDLGILLAGYMFKSNPGSYSQKFSNMKNKNSQRRILMKASSGNITINDSTPQRGTTSLDPMLAVSVPLSETISTPQEKHIQDGNVARRMFIVLTYFSLHWYKRDEVDELFGEKSGSLQIKDIIGYKKLSPQSFEIVAKDKKKRVFSLPSLPAPVISKDTQSEGREEGIGLEEIGGKKSEEKEKEGAKEDGRKVGRDREGKVEEGDEKEDFFLIPLKDQKMNYSIDVWLFYLNEAIKFNKASNTSSSSSSILDKETRDTTSDSVDLFDDGDMGEEEDTVTTEITDINSSSPLSNETRTADSSISGKVSRKFFKKKSTILQDGKRNAYEKYIDYQVNNMRRNRKPPIEELAFACLFKSKNNERQLLCRKVSIKEKAELLIANMENGDNIEINFNERIKVSLTSNDIRRRLTSNRNNTTPVLIEANFSDSNSDLFGLVDIEEENIIPKVDIQLIKVQDILTCAGANPTTSSSSFSTIKSPNNETSASTSLSPLETQPQTLDGLNNNTGLYSTFLESPSDSDSKIQLAKTMQPLPFYKNSKHVFWIVLSVIAIAQIKSIVSICVLVASLLYVLQNRREKAKQIPPFYLQIQVDDSNSDGEVDKYSVEYILEHPPKVFIEGCLGDMIEAKRRWESTYFWQQEIQPETFISKPHPHCRLIKENWANYHLGKTKNNDIIMIDRPGEMQMENLVANGITIDDLFYHSLYCVEFFRAKIVEDNYKQRIVSIFDVGGVQLYHVSGLRRQFLKKILGALQEHYPERSRAILIINAPRWFETIWKFVSTLLEDRVREKVNIASKSNSKALLEKYIPLENIPKEYGGEMEFKDPDTGDIYPDNCRFFHPSEKLLLNHVAQINAAHGVSFTEDRNEEVRMKYQSFYKHDVKC